MREKVKSIPYLGALFVAIYEFLFKTAHRIKKTMLRKHITRYRWSKMKREIFRAFSDSADAEIQELLRNIKKQGDIRLFNYPFADQYSADAINVYKGDGGYRYVCYPCAGGGQRVYFPAEWCDERIREACSLLLTEQDAKSPHCYVMEGFEVPEDAVVLDCGVAEGNFSVSIADRAKHIYLFEGAPEWQTPLELTFARWRDKVTIVPKYISDIDEGDFMSLDTFIQEHGLYNEKVYIKMDIEGYEEKALQGLRRSIDKIKNLRMAICTYHSQQSKDNILRLFEDDSRFEWKLSRGYMILNNFYDKPQFPYIRKGVLFVKK